MKTIRKSQYNFLKLLEQYKTKRNELITISDEEYNNLSQYTHKPIDIIDDNDSDDHGSDDNDSDDHNSDENNIDENDISEYIITVPKQPNDYYKYYNYPGSIFRKNGFEFSFPVGGGISVDKFVGYKNITSVYFTNYMLYQLVSTNKHEIRYLNSYVFKNCENLVDVHLNNFINHIYAGTFDGCTSLKNINMNNILYIDEFAFADCRSLNNIVLSKKGCVIGNYAFVNCISLENIENFSNIPIAAFANCRSLKSIKIPNNIIIEQEAFANCTSLTEVEFPDGVSFSGYGAFFNCSSLKKIIMYQSIKFELWNIFGGGGTIIEDIYVCDNLIEQYKNDKYILTYNVNVKSITEYTK